MQKILVGFCLANLMMVQLAVGSAICAPANLDRTYLTELRRNGFELGDEERNKLALELLNCVGHPDPAIRDGMVFEGLSSWLRAKKLNSETILGMYVVLNAQLAGEPDDEGFLQPFAALLLSEVARSDRVEPLFSNETRLELAGVASDYLTGVADYRGYSDEEGWRHGVAHGSDLALQLVLNPNIGGDQIADLMAAVNKQIAPAGDTFYIYGEPSRLARPVFYAYQREVLEAGYWQQWFDEISDPAPLGSWADAYSSNAGLAKRHNTLSFLMAMHLNTSALEGEKAEQLRKLVMDALGKVL